MGCDIHIIVQVLKDGVWSTLDYDPEFYRSYNLFGFLANVRNMSQSPVISEPRGMPEDVEVEENDDWCMGYLKDGETWMGEHSYSWLLASELVNYDYSQTFTDMRDHRKPVVTLKEFLGGYINEFHRLAGLADNPEHVRMVFGFDS